jgi:NADPH:quinone reductase-like Zn-dependent oxidoreductase
MKAAQITDYTAAKNIKVATTATVPAVAAGFALVEVRAAALNPIDWKMAEGELSRFMQLPFPFTPGSDFAGVVKAVGAGVEHIKEGDEVYGMAGYNRNGSGSLAELATANASFIWKKPASLSFEQAAAVPMAGLRAWHVLAEVLQLESGQRILIHGGAGGIGTFALQIAKHLGAYVATTASGKDLAYVKELGADIAIDYQQQDFSELLHDYDAVFDTIGGKTFTKSFSVLKPGGKITTMLWERHPDLAQKYTVAFLEQNESTTPRSFIELGKLIDEGIVKVQVDKVFPFNEVGKAFDYQKTGHPRGKVVVAIA